MLVIVAPGQGSQIPGFLASWLEDPEFAERLDWLSTVCQLDLARYGTEADADTIRDTAVAQPLLVASGLLALLALFQPSAEAFGRVDLVAGHSVGEITAAAGVGVMGAEQAMVFARERGKAMAEAAARNESGMAAVLGGDPEEVLATIERHNLAAVTHNGLGHVVASGMRPDLDRLIAEPPARSRVKLLQISGAFHSKHVEHVSELLGRYARSISTRSPRVRLLSNRDGRVVRSGREALALIVQQVSSPVHWNLCMDTMREFGVTGLLEVPPAGTLTGIARRAMPEAETFALNTLDQLDAARGFVDKHAESSCLLASEDELLAAR